MKKDVTTVMRAAVYFVGLAVFSFNTILLPELAREEAAGRANPPITYPFFVGAWILSIPILVALFQTLKLLRYIDEGKAFSGRSIRVLGNIKLCAISYSILIAISALWMFIVGKSSGEDMPPIILVGSIFTFSGIVVATFVAVLQRLLQNAVDMQFENDLTV